MALEQRGTGIYYYEKQRIGDQVVSIYRGSGPTALAMSQLDAYDRLQRAEARAKEAAEQKEIDLLLSRLTTFCTAVDYVFRSEMESAGYRRHNRGEWRRRRPHNQDFKISK